MTRVRVPDDYDRRDVPLPEDASSLDYENLRDVVGEAGRVAQVREDDEGRYVGVPEQHAADVADYLGVEVDAGESEDSEGADGDDSEGGGGVEYEERRARAEGLANEHWRTTVDAVESGDADDCLDVLADVDGRDSVQEAIEERRNELGDGEE